MPSGNKEEAQEKSYLQTPKGTVIDLPGLTKQTSGCSI